MQVILSAYEGTIDLPSDDGDDGDGDNGLHWPVCNDDESGTQRGGGPQHGGSRRGVSGGEVAGKDAGGGGQQDVQPRNIAQVFPFPHPQHPVGSAV